VVINLLYDLGDVLIGLLEVLVISPLAVDRLC
jgi:hypothetical protein